MKALLLALVVTVGCGGPGPADAGAGGGRDAGAAGGAAGGTAGGSAGGSAGGAAGGTAAGAAGGTAGGSAGGSAGGAAGGSAGGAAGGSAGGAAGGAADAGALVCVLGGWCWEHPTPFGTDLQSAVVLARDDVWVGGSDSATYHFDGARWRYHAGNQDPVYVETDAIAQLAFSSPTDGWALSGPGFARWSGSSWVHFQRNMTGSTPSAPLVLSPTNIIVGRSVYPMRWNGAAWLELDTWPYGMSGLWGRSDTDLWGVDGMRLQHFDGGSWAPQSLDAGSGYLRAIWGNARDIWVTGDDGAALRFDGTQWVRVATQVTQSLGRISGSGPDDVWAIGYPATVVHHDGVQFSAIDAGSPVPLTALSVSADAGVLLVGAAGTLLLGDAAAGFTSLTQRLDDTAGDLHGVHGSSASDVWAVGDRGLALHFDGTLWRRVATPTGSTLSGVFTVSPSLAYAVGESGVALGWNGVAWQPLPALPLAAQTANLGAVWAAPGGDVWVTGPGLALRLSGSTWASFSFAGGNTRGIWGASTSDVWVAADQGVFHYTGTAFTNTWSGAALPLFTSVWGSSAINLYATAANLFFGGGNLQRWSGSAWSPVTPVTGSALTSVSGTASNRVLVSGFNTLWSFDGSTWTSSPTGAGSSAGILWAGSPGASRLVGSHGAILRQP